MENVVRNEGRAGWRGWLWNPAALTGLVCLLLLTWVIAGAGGDALEIVRIGTRFSQGDPNGTEGYDGQFVYYIALNPAPAQVAPLLDVPAYRYQRILLPWLGRIFSLGNPQALPWVLALLGLLSHVAGTWAVAALLKGWKISQWYALSYGLWAGFLLGVRLALPEPLAYGLAAGGVLALERKRLLLAYVLLGLAAFAREVTVAFTIALLLVYLAQRQWKEAGALSAVALAPFALFQGWLWLVFGQMGIGSGGAMATPFEIIPLMGLLRIAQYDWVYLAAMALVFLPSVVLPAVWGIYQSAKTWLTGERNVIVLGLFLNALVIPFLPFSTFREPGGLLRFACGLVLAVLLFAARYRKKRVLNYSPLWIVLNVFLFKS